jgi:hypothetical protein
VRAARTRNGQGGFDLPAGRAWGVRGGVGGGGGGGVLYPVEGSLVIFFQSLVSYCFAKERVTAKREREREPPTDCPP